ncbi:hypothetical protein [uncultured Microscilla sp.]|uniref:hypothetical protein n=1 Tax=uncultured Microscilla sp. TaxID=432653 RepID=UPI002632B55C|nr:hypothetical protein [uncultured Microscilla sp.]
MHAPTTELVLLENFKTAKIYLEEEKNALIVTITRSYIPMNEFKEIFNKAYEFIPLYSINKLIFDKRKLMVFHQPSMEWYFVEWKEKAFNMGLNTIRKVLPDDKIFKQSVKIGWSKIANEHPNAKFHQMNIAYVHSIEQALND